MNGAEAIVEFIPLIIVQLIYAAIAFVVARKRSMNPWPWTIGTLIPILGMLVFGLYFLLSFLSVLDRLNTLERPANKF